METSNMNHDIQDQIWNPQDELCLEYFRRDCLHACPQKKRATISLEAEAEGQSQGPAEGEAFLEPQDFQLEGRCR